MSEVPIPVPVKLPRLTPFLALVAVALMAGAYLIFLYASWEQFQKDREKRDQVVNELLDRMNKLEKPAESE